MVGDLRRVPGHSELGEDLVRLFQVALPVAHRNGVMTRQERIEFDLPRHPRDAGGVVLDGAVVNVLSDDRPAVEDQIAADEVAQLALDKQCTWPAQWPGVSNGVMVSLPNGNGRESTRSGAQSQAFRT